MSYKTNYREGQTKPVNTGIKLVVKGKKNNIQFSFPQADFDPIRTIDATAPGSLDFMHLATPLLPNGQLFYANSEDGDST